MTNPFTIAIVRDTLGQLWTVTPYNPTKAIVPLNAPDLARVEEAHRALAAVLGIVEPEKGQHHATVADRFAEARASIGEQHTDAPVRVLLDPVTGRDSFGRAWVPQFDVPGHFQARIEAEHGRWIADRYSDQAREELRDGNRERAMLFADHALSWRASAHGAEPRLNAHHGAATQPRESGHV